MHSSVAAALNLIALLIQLMGMGMLAEIARARGGRWTPWVLLGAYLLVALAFFPPPVRVVIGDPKTPVNPYALTDALRYLLQSVALLAGCVVVGRILWRKL